MQFLIYNTRNGGYLGQALKNMRMREKTQACGEENLCNGLNRMQFDSTNELDIEWLKSAVVNDENIDEIKRRMISTIDHRKILMTQPETDPMECFPYLFTHPLLVNTRGNKLTWP